MYNKMTLEVTSLAENERFARATVGAFAGFVATSIDVIADVKTIVSEAVTNSIVHGYLGDPEKTIRIDAVIDDDTLTVEITDYGVGMEDVSKCMEDNYTTGSEDERSGLGFTIIKALSETVDVSSQPMIGTIVKITKKLS